MSARKGKPNGTGRSSGKIGGSYGKRMKPPKGEPWVWLTRELLTSDAWQSLTLNGRRFVDFLMIEHMNHAGTENGNLRATRRQLDHFGITTHRISEVIAEAETAGLVDCQRGGMRVATTYRLTFYALPDGTPPTNRWKRFMAPKNQKSVPESTLSLSPKVHSDLPDLSPKVHSESAPETTLPSISTPTSQQHAPAAKPAWHAPTCREFATPPAAGDPDGGAGG
jgi:hypothetical protein